jgi:molybdopterin-guanine dinucleotide biosynthesis protein A
MPIIRNGGQGPLPALIAGLNQLPEIVEAAFVTGCDAPLLKPALVEWLFKRWAAAQSDVVPEEKRFVVVAPADGLHLHPLCAVYGAACRVGLAAEAAYSGCRSLRGALNSTAITKLCVPVDELRAVDPELESLINCNTPQEYEAALRRCGANQSS